MYAQLLVVLSSLLLLLVWTFSSWESIIPGLWSWDERVLNKKCVTSLVTHSGGGRSTHLAFSAVWATRRKVGDITRRERGWWWWAGYTHSRHEAIDGNNILACLHLSCLLNAHFSSPRGCSIFRIPFAWSKAALEITNSWRFPSTTRKDEEKEGEQRGTSLSLLYTTSTYHHFSTSLCCCPLSDTLHVDVSPTLFRYLSLPPSLPLRLQGESVWTAIQSRTPFYEGNCHWHALAYVI